MIGFCNMIPHVFQNPLDMFVGGGVINLFPAALGANETRPFQQPQMMAGQRRRNPDPVGNFPHIARFIETTGNDPQTCGVAQQMKDFGDFNGLIFDHSSHT